MHVNVQPEYCLFGKSNQHNYHGLILITLSLNNQGYYY